MYVYHISRAWNDLLSRQKVHPKPLCSVDLSINLSHAVIFSYPLCSEKFEDGEDFEILSEIPQAPEATDKNSEAGEKSKEAANGKWFD